MERERRLSNVTMLNFNTEYQKLYDEKEELEEELNDVKNIIEMQNGLQKIINQGLSLKHPDTFVLEDMKKKAEFERMESSIKSSEVKQIMEKAGKEIFKQLKVIEKDKEIETRSRHIRYPRRNQVAFRPEAIKEPKLANKCEECSFMSTSKDSFDIHIKHHKEGFKCEHCEETCISKSILKEHIFSVHKNKIICSFFMKGKCTRSCEFQHPSEITYCKYGSQCPYVERGKCRYFHKMHPMWKEVFKRGGTIQTHEAKAL